MTNLISLNLKSNKIGNDGMHAIAIGLICKLRKLNVQYNEVFEDGFRVLAESPNFTKLTKLKIFNGNPGTSTESKNLLKRAHNLQALRFIH